MALVALAPGWDYHRSPGTEIHGAGRGRTIKAHWQNDRPLKDSHRAPLWALRRGKGDYHGKRQGGRERTAPYLPANKLQHQPDESEKAHEVRIA